jgi:hypothetical protein
MIQKAIVACSLVCGLLSMSAGAGHGAADDAAQKKAAGERKAQDIFRVIAEGYRTNRESFTAFSCRFKWTFGKAQSLEDARLGKFQDVCEHDGLWLVDGQRTRYDLICTTVNLAQEFDRARAEYGKTAGAKREGMIQLRGHEYFYLKNELWRARQSKVIKCVTLVPLGVEDQVGTDPTPFSLGVMGGNEELSPAALLKRVVEGQMIGRFDGTVVEGGRTLLAVSWGNKGERLRLSHRFDPERGYLPVRIWDSDPATAKIYYEAFILDAKNCGSGRWFPMRSIVVKGGVSGRWPKRVRETRVTDLKLERPDGKEFYLDVPARTQVVIVDSPNFFNIKKDTRVHESQLESLAQQAIEHHAMLLELKKERDALRVLPATPGR